MAVEASLASGVQARVHLGRRGGFRSQAQAKYGVDTTLGLLLSPKTYP